MMNQIDRVVSCRVVVRFFALRKLSILIRNKPIGTLSQNLPNKFGSIRFKLNQIKALISFFQSPKNKFIVLFSRRGQILCSKLSFFLGFCIATLLT